MSQIVSLRIKGFRAFGGTEQIVDVSPELTVVWAPSSQGKTSVAEAIEFFLSGRISRRELLGSASREFAGSLKNVHLTSSDGVSVSATVRSPDGATHDVVRTLTSDYSARSECTSTLTIDGNVVSDLATLGIVLSEPPLETPILLQHNLRFVLSARPQDRTNFFKAILEISDLEVFRGLVGTALDRIELPDTHLIGQLRAALTDQGMTAALTVLRSENDPVRAVEQALVLGLQNTLGESAGGDVAGLVAVGRRELETRREAVFPLRSLESRRSLPEAVDLSALADVARETIAIRSAADEVGRALLRLYEAYASLPDAQVSTEEPADCPLCLTPDALTASRVEEIRRALTETAEFRTASEQLSSLVARSRELVRAIPTSVRQAVPEVVLWDEAERREKGIDQAALALLLDEGAAEPISAWLVAGVEYRSAVQGVAEPVERLREALERMEPGSITEESLDEALGLQTEVGGALETLVVSANRFADQSGPLRALVVPLLDQKVDLRSLRQLVALSADLDLLAQQLERERAVTRLREDTSQAVRHIDDATANVLDEKFDELAGEISRWWQLMRSEEPSFFAGVQRAGTGRRFIDLKAGLATGRVTDDVTQHRDAVAVFSDSQLNCLGLSAFLARVSRNPVGFVVLDDPIQGSDTEHKATFLEYVPETLMSEGHQVIMLTHDERLSRNLQERYAHRDLRVYRVLAQDPPAGAEISRTRDTIDELLARVEPLRHQDDVFHRKTAGGLLRDAAERFCKLVLVADARERGGVANLADYDGRTLGPLINEVQPLLDRDPSHPGKLRTVENHTNPGNHDDEAPPSADIRFVLGELKRFCRDYLH